MDLSARATLIFFRTLFNVLNIAAPLLGAKLAKHLYITPSKIRKLSVKDAEFYNASHTYRVRFQSGYLMAREWGGKNSPAILLVHGWGIGSAPFIPIIKRLLDSDFRVITYDGQAHGESSGKRATSMEWADAIHAVLSHLNGVYVIIGHSLGAGALVTASKLSLNCKKLIFISPVTSIVDTTNQFAKYFRIDLSVMEKMRKLVWDQFSYSAEKYGADWDEIFKSDCRLPSLIIHDINDGVLPIKHSEYIHKQWPHAKFIKTSGFGHLRILANKSVIQHIMDFIIDADDDIYS